MFAVETFGDLAFGDIFLHLLMGNLALLADEFALEDFCRSLFDGFLLTASPRCPPPACTLRGSGELAARACGTSGRVGAGARGEGSVLGSAHPPRCCGLFQEGERAAPRAAAPHPPAPPGGPVQAGRPAEGAGAHGPGGCPASLACAARPAPMRPRGGGGGLPRTTHFPPCRAERP